MKRNQVRRLFALLAAALSLTACSALVSFSGLAGTAPGGDGGAGGTSGDASAIDDGATGDAGVTDASTIVPRFCADATGLALCDDFDDPDAASFTRWENASASGGGLLRIDLDASHSPPGSLLVSTPGGGGSNGAALEKTFTGHTRVRVAADLRLDVSEKTGYGSFLELHLSPNPDGFSDYRVALIYTSGDMTLDLYAYNTEGGTSQGSASVHLGFDTWRRIAIELAMLPTPHASAYDETGALIATIPMPPFAGSASTQGQRVVVGLPYLTSNSSTWLAHHDNVTVTVGD